MTISRIQLHGEGDSMTIVAGMIIGYLAYDSSASVPWNLARTAAGIVAMLVVWYAAKGVI